MTESTRTSTPRAVDLWGYSYTITKPDGHQLHFSGRANRVGYYYQPGHDFLVNQAGIWTVDLNVVFDGQTSAGQVAPPFPTGDVLGTASGRFSVYVVPRGSPLLGVSLPGSGVLAPPAAFDTTAVLPGGATIGRAHVTAAMPGFVLESGDLTSLGASGFAYRYDPVTLATDFPNPDVGSASRREAADLITVSLYAQGTDAAGARVHAARVVALHGSELLNPGVETSPPASPLVAAVLPASRSVELGATATAFATVIKTGPTAALSVSIVPPVGLPLGFFVRFRDGGGMIRGATSVGVSTQ